MFKTHPLVKGILDGGERVAWGAKALPGGGYWSMPKLSMPGAVLVGDAGGMVDTAALKGVHHCIKSGMLAAEAIYSTSRRGESLESYEQAIEDSSVGKELYQVRNTRQAFQKGFLHRRPPRRPGDHVQGQGSAAAARRGIATTRSRCSSATRKDRYPKPDGKYTFDKLSSVYITGNATRDDAPNHIRRAASTSRARSPRRGLDVPRRRLRDPRRRARERARST